MKIPDFIKAFRGQEHYDDPDLGEFDTYCHRLGNLRCPTGRIVVCDPLVFPKQSPLTVKAPIGRFPVTLCIAQLGKRKSKKKRDERIAAARVRFSENPVVKWKMALMPGQKLKDLKKGNIFGYVVDSGTGCFMDFQAAIALRKQMDLVDDYFENIIDAMHQNYVHTRDWANFAIAKTGHSLTVFSTGFGDGVYASFWGMDKNRRPACLVTDFGLLPFEVEL